VTTPSPACGLYYASELAEEYCSFTKRIITWMIYVAVALHVLLLLDGFPWPYIAGGLACHLAYYLLLADFPTIVLLSRTSFLALGGCADPGAAHRPDFPCHVKWQDNMSLLDGWTSRVDDRPRYGIPSIFIEANLSGRWLVLGGGAVAVVANHVIWFRFFFRNHYDVFEILVSPWALRASAVGVTCC
jgi:hypothetical protein